MLRIVMDGAGDLPPEWIKQYELDVIPINIHFGQSTFLQGVDLSNADFYRMAEESGTVPKTAQPSPQQFIEFYKQVAEPGDTILSIHVTSKLSGTFKSAELATREIGDTFRVIPFNSLSGSAAMGYMCREARQMDRDGLPIESILERLDFIRRNITILLTLNTLEYARKSGRVKALQAALASLLNVKPIVALKDGVLDMNDQVRTRRRALEFIVEAAYRRVADRAANVAVVQAEDPDAGEILMRMVRAKLNCKNLIMTDLSISVAANLGPGTVGIVAYPVE